MGACTSAAYAAEQQTLRRRRVPDSEVDACLLIAVEAVRSSNLVQPVIAKIAR
jgi:hypothetical protein